MNEEIKNREKDVKNNIVELEDKKQIKEAKQVQRATDQKIKENIFELKWGLARLQNGAPYDMAFEVLYGRMREKLLSKYPVFELLRPYLSMNDVGKVPQYRFRAAKNQHPLMQIGPGVMMANVRDDDWGDFLNRITMLVDYVYKYYPSDMNLIIRELSLYLSYDIDFNINSHIEIFKFLKERMNVSVSILDELFDKSNTSKNPSIFDFNINFPLNDGNDQEFIYVKFYRIRTPQVNRLSTELAVESIRPYKSSDKKAVINWIKKAHEIAEIWKFNFEKGE